MTPDKARKLLDDRKKIEPIIQAYIDGEVIQVKQEVTGWIDVCNPLFSSDSEYRIKPKPVYIPFTFNDHKLFKDKWIKATDCDEMSKILTFNETHVAMVTSLNTQVFITYGMLFDLYNFEDGSRCGKIK